jgi:hypothetical protein
MFDTSPVIRDACFAVAHAETVAEMIAAAKERYAPDADRSPESLALYTQAVIQGAFCFGEGEERRWGRRRHDRPLKALYIVLLFQPREEKAKCKTHSSGTT